MEQSENISELAAALSAFQGEVRDAAKDTQGYGYKYAKLDGVLEIVRPLLHKNGLSITQLVESSPHPDTLNLWLTTQLNHTSGQWQRGKSWLPIDKDGSPKNRLSRAQECGVAITFFRRYCVCAILGITQTDDDAALPEVQEALASLHTPSKKIMSAPSIAKPALRVIDKASQETIQLLALAISAAKSSLKAYPHDKELADKVAWLDMNLSSLSEERAHKAIDYLSEKGVHLQKVQEVPKDDNR